MSKKNARSWKLLVTTTAVLVSAGVLVLNVGASANVTGTGPVAQQSASPSGSASGSARPSASQSSSSGPGVPSCVPMVNCPSSTSPSARPSTSGSPTATSSPDPGGDDTYTAKISIDYSNRKDSFVGKVDSKAICQKARRVDLFEVAPGKDQNLGHALTNNKGKYRIPYPKANGRFYTKARKFTPDRNTTCKGATSKTISV
jgi:hypothetical protein